MKIIQHDHSSRGIPEGMFSARQMVCQCEVIITVTWIWQWLKVDEITDTTPDNMNSFTTESDSIYFNPWVKPQGYENIGNDH